MKAREWIETIQDPEVKARAYRAYETTGNDLDKELGSLAHTINNFSWSSTPDCYLWCKVHGEYERGRNDVGQFEKFKTEIREQEHREPILKNPDAVRNIYSIY